MAIRHLTDYFFVSLALFQEYDEGKQSEIKVDDRLLTSNAGPVEFFFLSKVTVSAKDYANL